MTVEIDVAGAGPVSCVVEVCVIVCVTGSGVTVFVTGSGVKVVVIGAATAPCVVRVDVTVAVEGAAAES